MIRLRPKLILLGLFFSLLSCRECKVDGDCNSAAGETCDAGDCIPAAAVCGDGVVTGAEQCEPPGSATCDAACQNIVPATCGNGNVETAAGEECEPPGSATCDASCLLITPQNCGDGIVQAAEGEVCDDGNTTAGDGCRADCLGTEFCGDELLDTAIGEECDPPGLTCDLDCTVADACSGFGVEGAACTQSAECCQLAGLGCNDTDADGQGDTCGLPVGGQCAICGTGGDAHPCECCDGIDNDGDGNIDTLVGNNDLQCLGPTDDNELEFATGVPGDNNGSNGATECPFDGNSGTGNDGECNLFVPNGCDCTLCCELDGNGNQTSENLFAGGGNCRDAVPNNIAGTEGGPCTFADVDGNGIADNAGGCGAVDVAGTNVQLSCILDGDGTTAYCSTCQGCQNVLQNADPDDDFCINKCNCCENCVGGIQSEECDPLLFGQDVGVEGNDGDADTINDCPGGGGGVCQTNIACTAATAGIDCPNLGETCEPGDNGGEVCFQTACTVNADCPDSATVCSLGCCVVIP